MQNLYARLAVNDAFFLTRAVDLTNLKSVSFCSTDDKTTDVVSLRG
jgi:hypothetical protein